MHPLEKVVAPHVLMHQRCRCVEASDQKGQIGREFVPFIDAVPRRSIACPELRQRPDTKQIEAAIQRVDNSQKDHRPKKNIEGVMRRLCDRIQNARVTRWQKPPEMRSPRDTRQEHQACC